MTGDGMRLSFVVALAFAAGIAHAQTPPPLSDAAQALVGGAWEVSNADRDRRCIVTFRSDAVAGGLKLELDPACAIVPLRDAVAWAMGQKDVLRFIDGHGTAILELSEVESGLYEGERKGEGLYFMQSQASAAVPVRTVEEMVGDWIFLREADKPLCTLTLTNVADGDSYKLAVKPRCDNAIANFGLTSWRLDRGELVLAGRGGTWRFGESDANVWERIPLGADPLLLMRQ